MGSSTPLVSIDNQQQQQQPPTGEPTRRGSGRFLHPFKTSGPKGKSTDKHSSGENYENKPPNNHSTEGPELPFEKLAAPFYLRPFSALDKRDTLPAPPPPPKEKPSAIPVPVESRRTSGQVRSTSSSYPSQGIRTPELTSSPPATVRSPRNFFSIGRYGRNNTRLSLLFSSGSSTKAELDSTESDRQPQDAVVEDDTPTLPPSQPVTDDLAVTARKTLETLDDVEKPEEPGMAPAKADGAIDINRLPEKDTLQIDPVANRSTETIVRQSGGLLEGPQDSPSQDIPDSQDNANNPEVIVTSPTPTASAITDDKPPQRTIEFGSPIFTSHEQRLAYLKAQLMAGLPGPPVKYGGRLNNSRASTVQVGDKPRSSVERHSDDTELFSGARGRKPPFAIRFGRRLRRIKFGKWVTTRLRMARNKRRSGRPRPAAAAAKRKGPELTAENLKRVERGDRPHGNTGWLRKKKRPHPEVAMVNRADWARKRRDIAKRNVDGGDDEEDTSVDVTDVVGKRRGDSELEFVLLPDGRVCIPSEDKTRAAAKHDTIGKRAAAWFTKQTGSVRGSVQLTGFLLREMRSEMRNETKTEGSRYV